MSDDNHRLTAEAWRDFAEALQSGRATDYGVIFRKVEPSLMNHPTKGPEWCRVLRNHFDEMMKKAAR